MFTIWWVYLFLPLRLLAKDALDIKLIKILKFSDLQLLIWNVENVFPLIGKGSDLTDFRFLQSVSGTNVIGILEGQFFNTANDEVVILGAHLDTRGILHEGVNNDGSGLVALISLAEDLAGKYCVQGKNARL